jgi:2-methylcitrate dehydratase PrpD
LPQVAAWVDENLPQWVANYTLSQSDDNILAAAKQCIIDTLGVAIAGSQSEHCQQLLKLSPAADGACTLIGLDTQSSAQQAAFFNAAAAHALDFDDTSYAGIVHASAVVLPAVLAACEQTNGSGADLLSAFICGVETEYAIGSIVGHGLYFSGYWCTATLGVIGAAAGAAKAFKLDENQTRHALRLAASMPIGLRAVFGSRAKPYLCAMAARLGVEAAQAAQAGIDAPAQCWSGPFGFLTTVHRGPLISQEATLEKLGRRMQEPGVALKRYPLCSATHAAIDALLALRAQCDVKTEIESIDCDSTPLAFSCLTYPAPETMPQAQFSMHFALACAWHYGHIGLEHLEPKFLAALKQTGLYSRIQFRADENLVAFQDRDRHPEAARVSIRLANGETLSTTVLNAQGTPQAPASRQQVHQKFFNTAGRRLQDQEITMLLDKLQRLELLDKARDLMDPHGHVVPSR